MRRHYRERGGGELKVAAAVAVEVEGEVTTTPVRVGMDSTVTTSHRRARRDPWRIHWLFFSFRAVFSFKIFLSKFHYSSITLNLLSHA